MNQSAQIALVLVVSIVLKFASKIAGVLNNISTILGLALYLYFIFDKVPSMLDKRFRTTIFRNDYVIRLGLVAGSFFLYLPLALVAPQFFMPSILSGESFESFDSVSFVLFCCGSVFSLSFLFGWRLWQKYLKIVEKIFSRFESGEQLKIDIDYIRKRGVASAVLVWTSGLIISALTLVLFFFWLVMWIIDYVYIAFMGAWLIAELVSRKTANRSRELGAIIVKAEEVKKRTIFWEVFVLGLVSGDRGISILLLMLFSFLSSTGLLVLSFRVNFLLIVSWVVFFGWYLLFSIIVITRRINLKIEILAEEKRATIVTRKMQGENIALIVLSMFFICVWATNSQSSIIQIQEFTALTFSLIPFFFAVVTTVYSVLAFTLQKQTKEETATQASYMIDKAKLAWLSVVGSLLLFAAFPEYLEVTLLLLTSIIVFAFEGDLKYLFTKLEPRKYGTISAVTTLVALMGTLVAICIYEPMKGLILPLSLLFPIFSVWSGIASYIDQRNRLRKRTGEPSR